MVETNNTIELNEEQKDIVEDLLDLTFDYAKKQYAANIFYDEFRDNFSCEIGCPKSFSQLVDEYGKVTIGQNSGAVYNENGEIINQMKDYSEFSSIFFSAKTYHKKAGKIINELFESVKKSEGGISNPLVLSISVNKKENKKDVKVSYR